MSLALQSVAHRDARWFALNRKVKLPTAAGGVSGHWVGLRGHRYGRSVDWSSKLCTSDFPRVVPVKWPCVDATPCGTHD